jgi:hypothetical protein
VFNFGPLPPISSSVRVLVTKIEFNEGAKVLFKAGEGASFLQPIQEGDNGPAVEQVDRG